RKERAGSGNLCRSAAHPSRQASRPESAGGSCESRYPLFFCIVCGIALDSTTSRERNLQSAFGDGQGAAPVQGQQRSSDKRVSAIHAIEGSGCARRHVESTRTTLQGYPFSVC